MAKVIFKSAFFLAALISFGGVLVCLSAYSAAEPNLYLVRNGETQLHIWHGIDLFQLGACLLSTVAFSVVWVIAGKTTITNPASNYRMHGTWRRVRVRTTVAIDASPAILCRLAFSRTQ